MRALLRFVAAVAAEFLIIGVAPAGALDTATALAAPSDPYKRLEEPAAFAETAEWARGATRDFEREAQSMPGFARLAARDAEARATERILSIGGPGSAPVLLTTRGVKAAGAATASLPAVFSYERSPSGRRAIMVASAGAEIGWGGVVGAGGEISRRFGPLWGPASVAWLDDKRLLYSAIPSADAPFSDGWSLRLLDVETGEDKLVFKAGEAYVDAVDLIAAERQPASPYVAILGRGGRSDMTILVADAARLVAGDLGLTRIAGLADEICGFVVRGRYGYALSTRGAPEGKLLKVDLTLGDAALAHAETIYVARPGETLAASVQFGAPLAAAGDGVYLKASRADGDALLFFPNGEGAQRRVALRTGRSISALAAASDGDGVFLVQESWFAPPAAMHVRDGGAPALLFAAPGVARSDYLAEKTVARSADGALVPMTILRKRSVAPDGARPAIVRAYASYGASIDQPRYQPEVFAWLDEGGVWATCGARGGGEKGRLWHRMGRSDEKPNSYADVVACARRLAELKLSGPERTALHTFSAGGLLAPALFRPDRPFAAAAIEVGMLNPLRGGRNYDEIGDPRTEEGRRAVAAQDGLSALLAAKSSPDVLVTCGFNDRRVQYWQALKFARAGLDRFGGSSRYVVLAGERGHASGQSNPLVYAFFLNRFHAPGFAPPMLTAGGPSQGFAATD